MKATAIHSICTTHRLIKTSVLSMVTILFLTSGTAYASHRHYGYNTGASITFDYIFYPKVNLYHEVYRQPRHYRYSISHPYRARYGYNKPWRNGHAYNYRRSHNNRYRDH